MEAVDSPQALNHQPHGTWRVCVAFARQRRCSVPANRPQLDIGSTIGQVHVCMCASRFLPCVCMHRESKERKKKHMLGILQKAYLYGVSLTTETKNDLISGSQLPRPLPLSFQTPCPSRLKEGRSRKRPPTAVLIRGVGGYRKQQLPFLLPNLGRQQKRSHSWLICELSAPRIGTVQPARGIFPFLHPSRLDYVRAP